MFNFFKKFQKQEVPHQNQNHFVNSDNSKSFTAQSLDRLPEIHLRPRRPAPRLPLPTPPPPPKKVVRPKHVKITPAVRK